MPNATTAHVRVAGLLPVWALSALLLLVLTGCPPTTSGPATSQPAAQAPAPSAPPWRAGTVSEYATLESGVNIQVSGYGIVVGLGKNGSDTTGVPPQIVAYLTNCLLKKGLSSPTLGTENVTPERVLRDKSTAIVLVAASVPAVAPVGTKYDLTVQALPQTQTTSLEGGFLMATELFLEPGGVVMPSGSVKVLASGKGPVFINPFLDHKSASDAFRFREGRILNGGFVQQSAPVRLVLRHPDYGLCKTIQERINKRFPNSTPRVANATTAQVIDLTVPERYRGEYVHFLDVILHLPLTSGGSALESKAKEVALAMGAPGANYEELALVWEAMDKPILPIVKSVYTSSNPLSSFYAARTGLRLGDAVAMEVIIHHARDAHSPARIAAIEEIGRNPQVFRGTEDLQELVDDPAEPVRVAAYEAMIRRGESTVIQRTNLGLFSLDVVKTKLVRTIYATQSGIPKIVLMGEDIPLQKEIYFNNEDVMISSGKDGDLTVVRKIQQTGRFSDSFRVPARAKDLVKALGNKPQKDAKGNFAGMGLSHGQIVAILYGMCKQHDIDANFVLQQAPGSQRIYQNSPAAVRPELPDK